MVIWTSTAGVSAVVKEIFEETVTAVDVESGKRKLDGTLGRLLVIVVVAVLVLKVNDWHLFVNCGLFCWYCVAVRVTVFLGFRAYATVCALQVFEGVILCWG